jgi:hypothetical protein
MRTKRIKYKVVVSAHNQVTITLGEKIYNPRLDYDVPKDTKIVFFASEDNRPGHESARYFTHFASIYPGPPYSPSYTCIVDTKLDKPEDPYADWNVTAPSIAKLAEKVVARLNSIRLPPFIPGSGRE